MRRLVLVVAAALAAGCLDPQAEVLEESVLVVAPALSGTACTTWSVVDVQGWTPGDTVGPFQRADIREDIGAPPVGTFGTWTAAGASGNWHALTRCTGADGGAFHLAWVGVKIERPAFDPEGPADQFVVSAVFSDAVEWVDVLQADLGDLVGDLRVGAIESSGPAFTVAYDLSWMGRFDAGGSSAPLEPEAAQPTRLWILLPASGGGHEAWSSATTYRPFALDLLDTPADLTGRAAGPGYFRHRAIGEEGQPVTQHTGNGQAVVATGFDRTVAVGPSPLVVLDRAYDHER